MWGCVWCLAVCVCGSVQDMLRGWGPDVTLLLEDSGGVNSELKSNGVGVERMYRRRYTLTLVLEC